MLRRKVRGSQIVSKECASEPEDQCREDTLNRTIQVQMIKPAPEVGNYPPRPRRVHLPPSKGYIGVEMVCPVRIASQQSGVVDGESSTAISTVPTQGSSVPAGRAGRAWPFSSLALSMNKLSSDPQSLSGVKKCREAAWKSSRIWKYNGSESMTKGYRN